MERHETQISLGISGHVSICMRINPSNKPAQEGRLGEPGFLVSGL